MASTIPHTQDLPREGGFPSIRYKRNLPRRGPSGAIIISTITVITAYGWYSWSQTMAEQRRLKREKLWGRIHIIPLLQAEADRDAYRRNFAALKREAEIMKDVPGWKVGESVYNTKRYMHPFKEQLFCFSVKESPYLENETILDYRTGNSDFNKRAIKSSNAHSQNADTTTANFATSATNRYLYTRRCRVRSFSSILQNPWVSSTMRLPTSMKESCLPSTRASEQAKSAREKRANVRRWKMPSLNQGLSEPSSKAALEVVAWTKPQFIKNKFKLYTDFKQEKMVMNTGEKLREAAIWASANIIDEAFIAREEMTSTLIVAKLTSESLPGYTRLRKTQADGSVHAVSIDSGVRTPFTFPQKV
ncbi:hypothetical protein G9A89_016751 [Geosiphon pyriformis]|nr:hypothetical protein G9A89_016751 [Geosiphon pyriformis]